MDVKALHAALDAARIEKDLSWRQLAKEIGVSASTISRMANGLKPDVTAFAAMTTWLRMPAETFYVTSTPRAQGEEPELVASLVPHLRARRDLTESDVAYLEEVIGAAARRFRAERDARSS
ncbi:helix-turn-helix transcriptional regulator [Microbispora bryophytorum]|uniref:helix-turn-helix domain-containing protein n=1 Tax=Microbispora bryophytorum TaxID=1460882 RepID=UPI003408C20E